MPANVFGNNVYSYENPMWHGLGTVGKRKETAIKVYSRMEQVMFELRPFHIMLNGKMVESKDAAIVRIGESEVQVGNTKGRYKITQPARYAEIFDLAVGQHVETMGFLGQKAEKMFITTKLPNIDVFGDEVESYIFLAVGFDGKFGEKIFLTNVRVVCGNTWASATYNAGETNNLGRGALYSGKHCYSNHEAVLAAWLEYVQRDAKERVAIQQGLFRRMEKTRVNKDDAYGLFAQVYPYTNELSSFYPDTLRANQEEKIELTNEKVNERRDLAMSLFEGAGIAITPTAWGVLNSVTEAENHHVPSKKDTAYSILIGNRRETMATAMKVVTEYVEVRK